MFPSQKAECEIAVVMARNCWWSECAAEAESQAPVFHCKTAGQRGSLIKNLRLLEEKYSKLTSSSLVGKDSTTLQGDGDKLNRWA